MSTTTVLLNLAVLAAIFCGGSCAAASGDAEPPPPVQIRQRLYELEALNKRVAIVSSQPGVALLRDVVGSFGKHAEVALELQAYALKRYPGSSKQIFGIYPDDPEAVGPADARWSLGIVLNAAVDPNDVPTPTGHFRVVGLPATTVAALDTTLGDARRDGLLFNAWLPLSGYVQVAPTRMVYRDLSGALTGAVTIEIPVKRRAEAVHP